MDLKTIVSLLLLLLVGLCTAHDGEDAENEIPGPESLKEDITTTILRMNKGSADILFEGDVIVPRTRNAIKCFNQQYSCVWPKSANGNVEIPFRLSDRYDNTETQTILSAMKSFEAKTCIRFIPRGIQTAYLSIEPRNGCSSLLGYTGGKQVVSLQRYGCIHHGTIQHELLHTLGFYHEHTRFDRDKYISINWENINSVYVHNFKKRESDYLDTPYDYSSIMHYGRTAFGMFRSETITPILDPSASIGQRETLSDIDILRINRLYKCEN